MLRTPAFLLALVLLASLLPLQARAQDAMFLQDASGDVRLDAMGTPLSAAVPRPTLDLLGLEIIETVDSFTFISHSGALPTQASTEFEGVFTTTAFAHNGREFQLQVLLAQPAIEPDVVTWFNYRDAPTDPWSQVVYARDWTIADRPAGTLSTTFERDLLADAGGTAPFRSRNLDGIRLETATRASGQIIQIDGQSADLPLLVGDEMPDGGATAQYAFQVGPDQSGHALLHSNQPFRASNGEATTFVYNVTADNLGDEADQYRLEVRGVPHGYTVNLPLQAISLEPRSSITFPVLLTMPFGHAHGSAASFVLEAHSVADPAAVGRVELGVRFLQVAQPAGHHETVYFHSHAIDSILLPPTYATFNTLEADDSDTGQDVTPDWVRNGGADTTTRTWAIELNPVLAMGIHVDPSKVGAVSAPVATGKPLLGASFSARLCAGPEVGDCTELASVSRTPPADLAPNSQVLYQGELRPAPDAPRVPFQRGSTLWLELNLTYTDQSIVVSSFGPELPVLKPGGFAVLPLQEWHDEVSGAALFGGPGLTAHGSQERLVNPGKTARFEVDVSNPLDHAATIKLAVSGLNAEWASLQHRDLRIEARGTARTSITVSVPAGTDDGALADLVLQAHTTMHPEALGLLRLVAEADDDATHADDGAGAADGKESPGLSLLALALALALVVGRRLRQRGDD